MPVGPREGECRNGTGSRLGVKAYWESLTSQTVEKWPQLGEISREETIGKE